jgi:hypothetical protein
MWVTWRIASDLGRLLAYVDQGDRPRKSVSDADLVMKIGRYWSLSCRFKSHRTEPGARWHVRAWSADQLVVCADR